MSPLEVQLLLQIRQDGHPLPQPEFLFDSGRNWRADFAWPERRILLEVEGGTGKGTRGRHVRPDGYEADIEKYNAAAMAGWCLVRCTGAMVHDGRARRLVKQVLESRPPLPTPPPKAP